MDEKIPHVHLKNNNSDVDNNNINNQHKVTGTEIQLKQVFASGLAAAVTRGVCQPLDVLKVRFQLQVEPVRNSTLSKYSSMTQAISLIYKEEGVLAFWKGHNPAQILSIIYGISQFWFYEQCKLKAKQLHFHQNNEMISNFLCGAMAGTFATIVTTPLDVIRTRLIAQDNRMGYPNTIQAFIQIHSKEGVRGLYRGLLPSVMQIAPVTGINFMCYKLFCSLTVDSLKLQSKSDIPAYLTLMNGALSGCIAKTIIYPLDLSKKRMQIQGFSEYRKNYGRHFKCHGVWNCLQETVQKEGILGLYKGITPSIWKAGFTSALNFCIYDNILNLILVKNNEPQQPPPPPPPPLTPPNR